MIEPSGCANHRVNAQCSEAADIVRSSVRRSEFDSGIDSTKSLMRKGLPARVAARIEFCAHVETVFGRELLDEPAHLSVPDNGEAAAHAPLRPVARSCVVMRA